MGNSFVGGEPERASPLGREARTRENRVPTVKPGWKRWLIMILFHKALGVCRGFFCLVLGYRVEGEGWRRKIEGKYEIEQDRGCSKGHKER
mgnify:CR=1 FL=1